MSLVVNTDIGYSSGMAVNSDTTARKLITLPHAMVRQIDDFRFSSRIKTESEAIRRLIELGLEAAEADSKAKPETT